MAPASRTQILDTACRLFAQRGVHVVTTAEISQAAPVSPGTLFRHFATKDALLVAAANYAQEQLCAGIKQGPDFPLDTLYHTIRRVWTAAAERALAVPHLFAYWVLAGTTPGVVRRDDPLPRLPVFQGAERVLARALATTALQADLLTHLLEAQWMATVQYVRRRQVEAQGPLPEAAALLALGYATWWAGIGLAKDVPLPATRV